MPRSSRWACPLLVATESKRTARRYNWTDFDDRTFPQSEFADEFDTLVLGCTHYHFAYRRSFVAGDKYAIVDSAMNVRRSPKIAGSTMRSPPLGRLRCSWIPTDAADHIFSASHRPLQLILAGCS